MTHLPYDTGVTVVKTKNAPKQITVTVAIASENSLSFQMMTPKVLLHFLCAEQHAISTLRNCSDLMFQRTFYKRDILLPFYIPVEETAAETQWYPNNWLDKFSYILSKSIAGKNQSENHFCR